MKAIGVNRRGRENGLARAPFRFRFTLALALLAAFLAWRNISGREGEVSPELAWREIDPLRLFNDSA